MYKKTTAIDQCAVQEDISNKHNPEIHSGRHKVTSGQKENKRVRYQITKSKPDQIENILTSN